LAQRFTTLRVLSALSKYLFGGGSRGLNVLEEEGSEDLGSISGLSEVGSSSKTGSSSKVGSSSKTGSSSKAELSLKAGSSSEAESSEKPSHSLGQV